MGARGRKSRAELTLIERATQVSLIARPEPPDHLSFDAKEEWREIVGSLPADHFPRATHPVLEAYCRHAVAARNIDGLIQRLEQDENATEVDYNRLLVHHERESRALAALAVRLGIAKATHIAGSSVPTSSPRPWEK